MCDHPNAGGVVSESELSELTVLFSQFEGAMDPLSIHCREAEAKFNQLVEAIYNKKVVQKFSSISLPKFMSYTRCACRRRIAAENRGFPCA